MTIPFRTWAPILALATLSVAAHANGVNYSFAIPQGIDPPVVIDLTALNTTQSFTGAELLDQGIEIHGQIPGVSVGSYRDILEVQFSLYTGGGSYGVTVLTENPYTPWNESAVQANDPNYETITLTAATGSAPLNDNFQTQPGEYESYLVFTATASGTPAFIDALRASQATVQATKEGDISRFGAVPEPGAFGMAVSLMCTAGGGLLVRRRWRRGRANRP
jgi:hypothetical protein